ncbi:MbnP family protein [Pedobacter sp. KR3-3]|uniref:MbnP family protein n=1 Tax=Pedobacter albus TaxID=3113905 RepID=A0ABU7I3H3_9SPHI|nr:MbnP family protein [Pedobacter sp. KR3-3]MEE1944010.1 MbnP family protein [Pedobacter sp. KR3-3]
MNIKNISISFAVLLTLVFTSCKKDETVTPADEKGAFTLEFDNVVNGSPLVLETQNYTNANGDSFNVSVFKYYVSNIKLTKADGSVYSAPESYILVDASKPASLLNSLNNVPAGDYTKISFIIGVDKERNLAGAQTGALDPALGMFWTWNSGYIFVKFEGTSPQSTAANKSLTFHIGGIVDPNNTIRTFSTSFSPANPLRIRVDKKPQLHFKVNVASLFTGNQNIKFGSLNFTMGGANSVIVADNYADGLFQLDHIHN